MAHKSPKEKLSSDKNTLENIQEKLRQSELDFYKLVESMPQMVWITKPDGYHEFYNKHWYDFTNTTFEDTKGEGWNEMFHPDDRKKAWKIWNHSLKTGEPYEIEYRLKNGNTGEWRWVLGRALPLRDENGKIRKWVGTCTDIHDQKHSEQNLKYLSDASKILSSSIEYKTTLKNIAKLAVPEIADWCTVDILHGDTIEQVAIAHVNPAKVKWAKALNKKNPPDPKALTGVPNVLRTKKAEFYPDIPDKMLVAVAKSKEELELMHKIGFSSVIIAPIIIGTSAVGAITFVAAESERHYTDSDLAMAEELASRASFAMQNAKLYKSAQDELKHRRKLESELLAAKEYLEDRVMERTEKLKELNTELERSNGELEDFAYVASHDLQEPLRKIQAFGNLLQEEYASKLDDGKLYVDRMQSAAGRMQILIEDLLTFSRVTTKALPKTNVDLNTIVKNTMSDLEIRIKDLHADIEIKSLPIVKADPLQMRQLFQNLLSNSLKFHKANISPKIKIYAKKNDDAVVLYVEDNGIGFDEKYLDRIFTVFQRLHGKEEYEGTGVGLAVVRKIVERHNGKIIAKSIPGKGATFIITLPIDEGGDLKHG